MSFIWSIFSKRKSDEDWESVLSNLATDIQKREVKLSEIRLRERRSTLLVTLYTLAGWMVYMTLWYLGALPKHSSDSRTQAVQKAIQATPVLVGPIIILFIRRIVQVWYARKGDAEEKTLQQLRKQQRLKVEEIKKKTNYYSTRDLLQRYDDPPNSPGLRAKDGQWPTSYFTAATCHAETAITNPTWPNIENPRFLLEPSINVPQPSAPPVKKWYDKVADALLGDDDHTPNASASRYALICEKCFSHNGLVKESMWAETQYVCPKCNHFNPAANSRKRAKTQPNSPASTSSPSPLRAANASSEPTEPTQDDAAPDAQMMEVDHF